MCSGLRELVVVMVRETDWIWWYIGENEDAQSRYKNNLLRRRREGDEDVKERTQVREGKKVLINWNGVFVRRGKETR